MIWNSYAIYYVEDKPEDGRMDSLPVSVNESSHSNGTSSSSVTTDHSVFMDGLYSTLGLVEQLSIH